MTLSNKIPQHKRLAQGESVGFKKGGSVGIAHAPNVTPVGAGRMVSTGGGSPLTSARRNNGVPGMCAGGAMGKVKK